MQRTDDHHHSQRDGHFRLRMPNIPCTGQNQVEKMLIGPHLKSGHLLPEIGVDLCFGIADAFAGPAAQAYLPSLVAPEQLPAANSVSQSTVQITTLVAPGPAGLCIKAFGTAWAFFLDAVSFLFILGALWRLPDPPSVATGAPRRKMLHSILDGL